MRKKIFAFIMAVGACFTSSYATIVQTVRLKNGSVLNGFIESQDRKDNISFRTENATICLNGTGIATTEQEYKLYELSNEWIKWAEENGRFIGTGDTRVLKLNEVLFLTDNDTLATDSIFFEGAERKVSFESYIRARANVAKVRIIEKGSVIKYVEMQPNKYRFNWSEVESITAARRPQTVLTGIDRIYRLKTGQEVRGQYAGESYNTLSLYGDDGMMVTYNLKDVVKYYYKGVNPKQTIFEQSKLLDVVITKTETVKGIIVERDFTENANHIIIQQKNASSRIIKFKDILSYSKEENSDYSEIDDVILADGEFMINRSHADSVLVDVVGNTVLLRHVNNHLVIKRETTTAKVCVEFNNPRHSTNDNLLVIKLAGIGNKKKIRYGFSTDIFKMNKVSPISSETSVNNTTKVNYEISQLGLYVLYNIDTKVAIPFEITE